MDRREDRPRGHLREVRRLDFAGRGPDAAGNLPDRAGIACAVSVTPAETTIAVGVTQQFSAELFDLHGEPLVGLTVAWSSGEADVVNVEADELAAGEYEVAATITASAGTRERHRGAHGSRHGADPCEAGDGRGEESYRC
jgi:hypothetical protein